jgi:hypothetical protein
VLVTRGSIGQSTRKNVNYKPPSYTLHDEALFKDPPGKEDYPICFLPMPIRLICCVLLPPVTILSVPYYNFAKVNEELASKAT